MIDAAKQEDARRKPTGRCQHCHRFVFNGGKACKARRCPGYAPLWAGDQRRKLFDNLLCFAQMHGGNGSVALATVTGPGQDVLPWNRRRCAALGPHKCSGKVGCRVHEREAREWNHTAPARWRRLHRRAYQETKRRHPKLWLLVRVWEMQHRGVLHAHPVLAAGTPAQARAARAYVDVLAALAPKYGFGYVDRKLERMSAKAAAAYLSAYFVTGKREKVTLRESVLENRMPRSIVHVSSVLTQTTGVTMRELRFRRFVWARWGGLVRAGYIDAARQLAMLEREIGRRPEPPEYAAVLISRVLSNRGP